jgi:hypothetical protein
MGRMKKSEQSKPCGTCGATMFRKRSSERLEDLGVFNRRKYCSRSCGNSRQEVKTGTLLWRARRHRKKACEACGYTRFLHAHHVDQNQENNDQTNLQTLCKHCHNFWHTAAKRLGLEVAGRMPFLGFQQQFPTGHTDLKPSEMPLSPKSSKSSAEP